MAISIVFSVSQAPDTDVNRVFTAYAVKKIDGSRVLNPVFLALTSSSTKNQVTLEVSSADNADSGLYTVGFEAVFESGKATKSCSVDLEILPLINMFNSSQDREPARFVDSKGKEGII